MSLEQFDIKKALTYYAVIMVVAGTIKLKLFYGAFNLEILNYLDTSEILLAFIGDLVYYVALLFFVLLFVFLVESAKDRDEHAQKHTEIIEDNSFKKRLVKVLKYNKVFVYLISFNIILLIINLALRIDYSFTLIILIQLSMYLTHNIIALEYRRKYIIIYGKQPNITNMNIFLLGLMVFGALLSFTYFDVSSIKNSKKYNGSLFIVSGDTIRSDKTSYYIGKTNNYIFYYKEKTKSCVVYPMKDVTLLEIKINADK